MIIHVSYQSPGGVTIRIPSQPGIVIQWWINGVELLVKRNSK